MKVLGIDVGSLNTKIIILDDGEMLYRGMASFPEKGETVAKKSIARALTNCNLTIKDIDSIHLTSHIKLIDHAVVKTPVKTKNFAICLSKGAVFSHPGIRTVIDIGAENVTAVSLDADGKIKDFAQNDKCAAGSGAFLEDIAKMMGISVETMILEALKADKGAPIASTCTIFAEQEVLSTVFDPSPPSRNEILAGVHDALASRVFGQAMHVGLTTPVMLCGGVANNRAFVRSFRELSAVEVIIPEHPEFIPALGAALM